jgi:hypothetical protein
MAKSLFSNSIFLVAALFVSLCCTGPKSQSTNIVKDVTFLHVPLVCNAAPSIGCGSKAKFIMLDLMKDPAVKEAWLNRQGTVMAAVWREGTTETARQQALKAVFSGHELNIDPVNETDRTMLAKDFETREQWYKGADVDALSIEEAGVIADRVLTALSNHAKFKNDEDKQAFREDTKGIMQRCFLSLKSFDELDNSSEHNTQEEIYLAAVKYIGKENMPAPEVIREEYEKLRDADESCARENMEKNGACCTKESKKAS